MTEPDNNSDSDIGVWYADLIERHGEEEGRARARAVVDQAGCVTKPHMVRELRALGIDLGQPVNRNAEGSSDSMSP